MDVPKKLTEFFDQNVLQFFDLARILIARMESCERKALEHVPKKLIDFFDQDMLQHIDFERILFDRMIPCDRDAL